MPEFLIIILAGMAILASFFGLIGWKVAEAKEGKSICLISLFIWVFLLSWVIYASVQPYEVEDVKFYPISKITFANGQSIQLAIINQQEFNVNRQFSCIVPDNSYLKATRYKKWSKGVLFTDLNISYELVPEGK